MSDSPNAVPDGVSSQYLKQLLEQSRPFIPTSTALPVLPFGGESGGICDLALVVALLLTRSDNPSNPTQTLVMAMSMLAQLAAFYEEQLVEMEASGGQQGHIEATRLTLESLHAAQEVLAPVTALRIELSAMFRMGELMRKTTFSLLDPASRESRVLVSDEMLAELQLERPDVDKFLTLLLPGITQ